MPNSSDRNEQFIKQIEAEMTKGSTSVNNDETVKLIDNTKHLQMMTAARIWVQPQETTTLDGVNLRSYDTLEHVGFGSTPSHYVRFMAPGTRKVQGNDGQARMNSMRSDYIFTEDGRVEKINGRGEPNTNFGTFEVMQVVGTAKIQRTLKFVRDAQGNEYPGTVNGLRRDPEGKLYIADELADTVDEMMVYVEPFEKPVEEEVKVVQIGDRYYGYRSLVGMLTLNTERGSRKFALVNVDEDKIKKNRDHYVAVKRNISLSMDMRRRESHRFEAMLWRVDQAIQGNFIEVKKTDDGFEQVQS